MSKLYTVTVPIAGHAHINVEADNREDAIAKALESVTRNNIDEWVALKQFNKGNVCYCPRPWIANAICVGDNEEEM